MLLKYFVALNWPKSIKNNLHQDDVLVSQFDQFVVSLMNNLANICQFSDLEYLYH